MKQSILLNGQKIEYDLLQRSNARSIKVRVVFGKLRVSAPYYVSMKEIESFIQQNEEVLLSEIETSMVGDYKDHGYVYILGHKVEIIVRDMNIHKCVLKDGKIYVYHRQIQKEIENYLQANLEAYMKDYIDKFVYHNPTFPKPEITYKRSVGKYGCCYYTKNRVCFNPLIIHYKKEFIDSVIIHEMCHFHYHDHSPSFYLECEKYMPNYKAIKEGKKFYD